MPGPKNAAAVLQSEDPLDFLELVLTDELLEMIVEETNRYALQTIPTVKNTKEARVRNWYPVDLEELKTFFGLVFLSGVIHKPEIDMNWSTDEVYETPYFGKCMSRNRFQIILRFLHCADNQTADKTDKMYKVKPVSDYLIAKFKELYQPDEQISIDEGTLMWRGRLSFKVYNPQKPIRYGIKSYILAESKTGYCYNLRAYCGDHSSLADTVLGLLGDLEGQGYKLFMDNFYQRQGQSFSSRTHAHACMHGITRTHCICTVCYGNYL